jgi:hypothetical protein
MARNVFENNEQPELTPEEMAKMEGEVFSVLPQLADGYNYEISKLASGKTLVRVQGPKDPRATQHWASGTPWVDDKPCRLTYSHTRQVCGHRDCRES